MTPYLRDGSVRVGSGGALPRVAFGRQFATTIAPSTMTASPMPTIIRIAVDPRLLRGACG